MKNVWDLSFIYPTEDAFNKDLDYFEKVLTPKGASYEGKLHEEASLIEYFHFTEDVNRLLVKLLIYAGSSSDLNKKDVARSRRDSLVTLAYQKFNRTLSFAEPEILSLGEEKVKAIVASHQELDEFSLYIDRLFRGKDHVLSADKEKLIANYAPLLEAGSELYSELTVADYVSKKAKLHDGQEVEVTMSNWPSLIGQTPDPQDRQTIFEALYSYFDAHKTTYAGIYSNVLTGELSVMRSRGYSSILQEHLYDNKIPEEVFHNLVEVASTKNAALKKYYAIKAKYFGLPVLRSYDRFLHLSQSDKKYTFEEAKDVFWASIAHFPQDFQNKAHEVLKEGYVDVYPAPGKRTGAYSNGTYDLHPLILLNFEGRLDDVFTIAHESGHSIHTLYSEENQPLLKQDYTIFVAEIASTFNEHNLLDYLLNSGTLSKNDQIYLLQKSIDEIVSTFYRQTLFAQYEYEISLLAEQGQPINYEVLSDEMTKLYKQYYGIDIKEEVLKPLVWAYIPHLFYTPFYVYQYATSFTASMLLYQKVKDGEKGAFDRYTSLLKSGSSDYPVNEVLAAGVDLTKKETFLAVSRRMEDLVDRLEVLLTK